MAGMDPRIAPSARESRVAFAYAILYLGYLFVALESELAHWLTLVIVPVVIAVTFGDRRGERSELLATFGLRRQDWKRGIVWALVFGALITVLQVLLFGQRHEILAIVQSGRALWLYPLTLLLMFFMAGFTEEFFFRGFLQTRVEVLVGSPRAAIAIVTVLFSIYHLPYAYLNPMWPSAGDWGLAWRAAFANGLPGGLVLGSLYQLSGRNLVPCIVLHSMINAAPAMTLIRFGG
jgi:membrane protease YdiL (CAAX protease family)